MAHTNRHLLLVIGLVSVPIILTISCLPSRSTERTESPFNNFYKIPNIRTFQGDSFLIKLTAAEVGEGREITLAPLDSIFYNYYSLNNKGFETLNTSHIGGPSSYQFYYGQVKSKNPEYKQILILQRYNFNDTVNSLFLLTFNERDSLVSTLEVASLIYQAEIEPVFSSMMYPDRLVKYEVTTSRIPDNLEIDAKGVSTEPSDTLFLFCRDSIRKEFIFNRGNYLLLKKDSVRPCVWKNN